MRTVLAFLAICACLTWPLSAAGIRYGMTRVEVEAELGKPSAVLTHGGRLVLLYPHGGRVEFDQGVVTTAVNVAMDAKTSGTPAPTSTVPNAPAAAPAVTAPSPATTPPAPKAQTAAPQPEDAEAKAEAEAGRLRLEQQRRMEAITERLEEEHGKIQIPIVQPPRHFWMGAIVGWLCRIVITVVVLKMAFKWSDVHADWSQMFIPALADAVTQSVVQAGAYAIWKTDQLFHVDAAISYFVLLGVLMKTTHACTLQRAVAVAGAAKLASLVVWALVSVLLLQLLT